ncbi:aldehyde dehydrogenase family protein [Cellulosimicrobium funkei]|nr:aldehyde dehydrogenase family protein [Cellulosimicrobium funkei]
MYIDGWARGTGGTQDVVEVATGRKLGRIGLAGADDVDNAVASACAAQQGFALLTPEERAAGLLRMRDNVAAADVELTQWLVREAGATRAKAKREIGAALAELAFAAERLALGRELVTNERRHYIRHSPVGVVGIITPFNAPLVLAMRALAPALARGNAVVLKPDPRTAVSGGLLLPALLESTGFPSGLLSILPGGKDVGARLSQHPGVASILFTGSTPVGQKVGEAAGRTLKRIGLELGGNNPVLVLADADIERTVDRAITSSFLHSGQICMAAGQYLIERTVYDDFVDSFCDKAARLRVGDPWADGTVDMGPVIDNSSVSRLTRMVEKSMADGAILRSGGDPAGRFFPATVLCDVPERAPAWTDEVFGPVAPLRAVKDVGEAISLMNASPFGLVSAVHTGDLERGRDIASRLQSGTVRINDVTNHDDPRTPMVGHGESGNGSAFGGPEMTELLTRVQLISATR